MKPGVFLLAGLLCGLSVFAQKETDNWYFGSFAGVNFSTGTPVAVPVSNIFTTEGSASISDTSGNLLFYSDGVTVYNSAHQVMPNGTGLTGDPSSTQSALFVRKPGSYDLYYLFTITADGGPDGLRYSIIDRTLQGGLGDVTATKNVLLLQHMTEKLCAVTTSDDSSVWIMAHGFGSNSFYAYKLTAAGLSTVPVISNIGTVHDSTQIQNAYGYMKFSPDGEKLALAIAYQDKAEIFNFNDLDGTLNTPVTLSFQEHTYGLEFSPGATKLYLTRYNNLSQTFYLDQYDLLAGNAAAIAASQQVIAQAWSGDELRALQLANDGKIYVARSGTGFLDIINAPEEPGALCNFLPLSVPLNGNMCMLGLPNFNAALFREILPPVSAFSIPDSTVCVNSCISFTDLSLNNPSSWSWSFPGGVPSSSTLQNPGPICYNSPGVYNVTLITSNAKGADTLQLNSFVTVLPAPPAPAITVSGSSLTSTTGTSYQWYLNNTPLTGATGQSYSASQSGSYTVEVWDSNGCSSMSAPASVVVGISDVPAASCTVFPNPAADVCTVTLAEPADISAVRLTDLNGRSVTLSFSQSGKKLYLDLRNLPAGIYRLSIPGNGAVRQASLSIVR